MEKQSIYPAYVTKLLNGIASTNRSMRPKKLRQAAGLVMNTFGRAVGSLARQTPGQHTGNVFDSLFFKALTEKDKSMKALATSKYNKNIPLPGNIQFISNNTHAEQLVNAFRKGMQHGYKTNYYKDAWNKDVLGKQVTELENASQEFFKKYIY